MQPAIYAEYLRVIHEAHANDNLCHFDETMFSQADTDRVALVIKNYNKVGGMSEYVHRNALKDVTNARTSTASMVSDATRYAMKGPMGKGLQVEKDGVHIAFTAGTGCLLFLDLVAHLVRKNLKMLNSEEEKKLDSNTFKFIFFMSFPSREESVALELCEGLKNLCTKYHLNNFELHVRLTNQKPSKRWDHAYIDEVLAKYSNLQEKEDLETVTTH